VLAGIGVSWLTRLEQGRANQVWASVIASLARALRLDPTETAHLHALAELPLPEPAIDAPSAAHTEGLVTALDPNPAYVLDRDWDLVTWNRAEEELFPVLATVGTRPNLLSLMLEQPELRTRIADWPAEVARLAGQLRAHLTAHPSAELEARRARLCEAHPLLADAWARQDVAPLVPHDRVIMSDDGPRHFAQHRLTLPDHPGWQLVVFVPLSRGSRVPRA